MDCQQIINRLDDLLDGLSATVEQDALYAHVETCPRCRRRLEEARILRDALRALPVPPPRPGFAERALTAAVRQGRRRENLAGPLIPAALAAGLALVIGLAVLFTRPETATQTLQLAMSENQPQTVRLMFDTPRALQDVTLSVRLPQHVELQGYPGQQDLRWQADLHEGQNLLALTIIPQDTGSGILNARLVMGDHHRRFRVRIDVSPGADDARLRDGAEAYGLIEYVAAIEKIRLELFQSRKPMISKSVLGIRA